MVTTIRPLEKFEKRMEIICATHDCEDLATHVYSDGPFEYEVSSPYCTTCLERIKKLIKQRK